MNFKNLKFAAFGVLMIALIVCLFLFWVPMMRRESEAIENAEKAIRESKQTIEQTKLEMERIENSTPQIPRVPDGNGSVI